jgi:hypothetical protein
MNYTVAYAIGFHPWEDLTQHPPFANKLLERVAREGRQQAAVRPSARSWYRQRSLGRKARATGLGRDRTRHRGEGAAPGE